MSLLHRGRFPGSEQDVRVLMLPVSAQQTALSAQFSLFIASLRFAARAVRRRDHLVVCDGLRKARLTREELRFLEVAAHSVQHFRCHASEHPASASCACHSCQTFEQARH